MTHRLRNLGLAFEKEFIASSALNWHWKQTGRPCNSSWSPAIMDSLQSSPPHSVPAFCIGWNLRTVSKGSPTLKCEAEIQLQSDQSDDASFQECGLHAADVPLPSHFKI